MRNRGAPSNGSSLNRSQTTPILVPKGTNESASKIRCNILPGDSLDKTMNENIASRSMTMGKLLRRNNRIVSFDIVDSRGDKEMEDLMSCKTVKSNLRAQEEFDGFWKGGRHKNRSVESEKWRTRLPGPHGERSARVWPRGGQGPPKGVQSDSEGPRTSLSSPKLLSKPY